MKLLLFIVLIANLVFMVYEDLKYRGIQWWAFVALLGVSYSYSLTNCNAGEIIKNSLNTLLILCCLLICILSLYYLLKRSNIREAIGLGDILFLVAIIPLFSTLEYLFFISMSFVVATLIHCIAMFVTKQKTVPLAGYQSAFLCLYMTINFIDPNIFILELLTLNQ